MGLWDSWVAVGLLSAAAWGLSCVIDACFVGEGVYRKPQDGPVVAGLFCMVPVFFSDAKSALVSVEPSVIGTALLAGVCYLLHVYFYFRALFTLNDASNAEIFNTLSVLIVPLLAFVVFGEILLPVHYLAIGLSIAAVLILIRGQIAAMTGWVTFNLGVSVFFVSVLMVMQAWVLQSVAYEVAVLLFSLAAFCGAVTVLLFRPRMRRRMLRLGRQFGIMLVAVQILELGAVFGSQRATDVGPSVSLVALLECSLPVFVMGFSWLLLGVSRFSGAARVDGLRITLAAQTKAYPAKLFSLAMIVLAIGLVRQ